MDYFALLQKPRRPWLDPDALKSDFLRLAAQFHPDKIHHAGEAEKAAANQHYAELNAAYQTLLEPKDRLRHLLELESAQPLRDVQNIPPGLMDTLMKIGLLCREVDAFLAERAKTTSPLLKAQLFQKGLLWTDKLNELRQPVDALREGSLQELKQLDARWESGHDLAALEQIYRMLSYVSRWTGQIQERIVQLSF